MHTIEHYGQEALRLMAKHHVPPTPDNYAVWYRYASGQDSDIVAAIDAMIADGTAFGPVINACLYDKIGGGQSDANALHEAGARLQEATEQLMSHVREAEADAASQGDRLATISGGLARAGRAKDVAQMAKTLAQEARRLSETNAKLERRLSASSTQVEELQAHLETLRQEATTDALTGLANRKALDTVLRETTQTARSSKEPVSFLLADIDHFKQFNDRNGHSVGDQVLKLVAKCLRENLKGRDLPARYGGEEFAVVLPATTLKDAAILADQLRGSIASRQLRNRKSGENYGQVTISIGVAQFREGEDIQAMFERADKALYAAKKSGRNRVEIESKTAVDGGRQGSEEDDWQRRPIFVA